MTAKRKKATRRSGKVTLETVRRLALALPGVEEGLSYGTPAFRVRKKLFLRLWEDGETLVVRVDFDAREALLEADPASFFLTDHYRGYPMMLVRLPVVKQEVLAELIDGAWRSQASAKLVNQHEANAS